MNYDMIYFKPVGFATTLVKSMILHEYCKKNNLSLINYFSEKHKTAFDILNINLNIDFTKYDRVKYLSEENAVIRHYNIKKFFIENHLPEKNISNIEIFDTSDLNTFQHKKTTLISDFVSNRNSTWFDSCNLKIKVKHDSKIMFKKPEKILSFNLLNYNDHKPLYKLYEYWVDKVIQTTGINQVYFVSGCENMLKYFNEKYNSVQSSRNKTYEERHKIINSNLQKQTVGSTKDLIYDLVDCSYCDFWSLRRLLFHFPNPHINEVNVDKGQKRRYKEYQYMNSIKYQDSFDILVNYLKTNLVIH
jgi:hypothetical protein